MSPASRAAPAGANCGAMRGAALRVRPRTSSLTSTTMVEAASGLGGNAVRVCQRLRLRWQAPEAR